MSSPLKKRVKTDTDTDGVSGSEASPVLVMASTSTEEAPKDKSMQQIEKSCPLLWNGRDSENGVFGSMDEDANLYLTVGWENDPGQDKLMEKCLKYIDAEEMAHYSQCEPEDFNAKAAEKALRKDGSIDDVFQFTTGGKSIGYYWYVSCQYKKKLTKEEATETIQRLFDGYLCTYPVGHDNFGKTPFSADSDDESDNDSGDEDNDDSDGENETVSLLDLKDSVLMILKGSSFVAHSSWKGLCQSEENSSQIEREDFFFFESENGQKFLLKFGWSYTSG